MRIQSRQRGITVISVVIALAALLIPQSAESGPLRKRERFNIHGDGFWMKGRCFFPGRAQVDPEWNVVFPGSGAAAKFGCLVKNRKGKRRPGKRRADAFVSFVVYAEDDRGRLHKLGPAEGSCTKSRRCRIRIGSLPLSVGPDPRVGSTVGSDVVGMAAKVCGQRPPRTRRFNKPSAVSGLRLDWCLKWGTECGDRKSVV